MSSPPQAPSGFVFVADGLGYSAHKERDEIGMRARFNALLTNCIQPTFASHGGQLVSTAGGGLLLRAFAQQKLFASDTSWAYSNVGYVFACDVIAKAAGKDLGDHLIEDLWQTLGARTVKDPQTQEDFADILRPTGQTYHPGWVYHRCLYGTARDAAQLLHAPLHQEIFDTPQSGQDAVLPPAGWCLAGPLLCHLRLWAGGDERDSRWPRPMHRAFVPGDLFA